MRVVKVEIEGFGSIRDKLVIEFPKNGLLCIKAKNVTGKSTIINAINWAYYGKTVNDKDTVSTWEYLRDNKYRGTRVYIKHIRDGKPFEIERYKDYQGTRMVFDQKVRPKNGLFIRDNGNIPDEVGKKDKQSIIDSEIGL